MDQEAGRDSAIPQPPGTRSPHVVLAMLLVVYIFSYIDRLLLSILAEPVKADLSLNDTQMGLLGGLAFALLYSTMGVPLALVADRRGRSLVITVSLAVWSGFTGLCGFAANFWHMFLARVGVGIGEAGGVAPSYALISDSFPPEQRARATGIYMMGIPLGSAAGAFFGAWIASSVDWRLAFLTMGVAGLILTIPFRLLVRDAPASPAARSEPLPLRESFSALGGKASFWLICLATGIGSMCTYGLNFWLPSVLGRSFGLDLYHRGAVYAALVLFGGGVGMWLGGYLGDRFGRRNRAAYGWIPGLAMWASVPLFAIGILSGNIVTAFLWLLVPQALSYLWSVPALTAAQHLAPSRHRATAAACVLFFANAIGFGLGTPVLGWLSDLMRETHGEDSLRYAMLAVLSLYLVAGAMMLWAARFLPRDWVD
ncbi:MFS transporter [Tsuneonella sp. CC-YZS046]|uniref:spinster family MFS transporter n=1 Tax=Tsuneonella sp. CC-YZS046 TaxID=3042152 RepID=UPI002D7885CF|nr:MFS transporter [Tsuneonella sp. CC-YZS046]WRO65830.1 MFS transporter [Tsuneonella sp. CC-YZS046]